MTHHGFMTNNILFLIFACSVFLIMLNAPHANQYQINYYIDISPLSYFLAILFLVPLYIFHWNKPTSVFIFGYYFLILLPPLVTFQLEDDYNSNIVAHIIHFLIIYTLVVIIQVQQKLIRFPYIGNEKFTLRLVIILITFSAAVIIILMREYLSLSIVDVFKRRIAARDLLGLPVLRYLFQWSVGFVLIYAAVLARNHVLWRNIVILLALSGFLTVGVKAATGLAILISLSGFFRGAKKINHDLKILIIFLIILPFISILSELFFSYSYINDYFIRRLISVNGIIQHEFWLYIYNPLPLNTSVEYHVGEILYDNGTNGNVNWFLTSLANEGILSTAVFTLVLFFVLWMLDVRQGNTRSSSVPKWIAFGLIFFVSEQDLGVVLLSSGGFLVMLLEIFRKRGELVR